MQAETEKLPFASDYMEGGHPKVLERLVETNMEKSPGYGLDAFSERAREKIRSACNCPQAEVHFLSGGTQTNATVIDALLRPYQGVAAAESGHINTHEAGAIEHGGHKVLTLPQRLGKLTAGDLDRALVTYWEDENHEHMVMPGMVYLSQPTELGALYSLAELTAIHQVCRQYDMALYVDGARLAYALACPENDVTLEDLARLCDAFYIGGTKCGALFGEALVVPRQGAVPHLLTVVKQHGALLAKGRLLGVQFDALFTDDLYLHIGEPAIRAAEQIRAGLAQRGYPLAFDTPTNQIFVELDRQDHDRLAQRVAFSPWEKRDGGRLVIRLVASWSTTEREVERLLAVL